MRAYFIAGFVSLSFAACSGGSALAQKPSLPVDASTPHQTTEQVPRYWDQQPSLPTGAIASNATGLSNRLGDLFSKTGKRLAIAMGSEQDTIVTAGGVGQTSSAQPLEVPWASRDQKPFSFAEVESSGTHALRANSKHGSQVRPMTPQVTPHLHAQAPRTPVDSTISNSPTNKTVPWQTSSVDQDTPVANSTLLDYTRMVPVLQRPSHRELAKSETGEPLPARLASSAKSLGSGNDNLSLLLPVPVDKLDFPSAIPPPQHALLATPTQTFNRPDDTAPPIVRSAQPMRVAMAQQQVSGGPPSASDRVVDLPEAPQTLPPAAGLITDQTYFSAGNNSGTDKPNIPAERLPASDESAKLRRPSTGSLHDQTPLLNTASMIGPLKGAEQLFSRLDLAEDLRIVAAPAAEGPREDVNQFEWMPTPYTWSSPVFYHYPLYFEQPNLERYGIGQARMVQPLLSSAHFFWSIPLVPYKSLMHHPREQVYTLGQGRPGNCVPVQRGVILGLPKN